MYRTVSFFSFFLTIRNEKPQKYFCLVEVYIECPYNPRKKERKRGKQSSRDDFRVRLPPV